MSTVAEPEPAEQGPDAPKAKLGPGQGGGRSILQFEITAKKVKPVHLMSFCRYLSVFLTAGIPILDALDILLQDTPDKRLKRAIIEISSALRVGDNFSTAIAVHRRAFPTFFVTMLTAAEETGNVADVLGQLARYIERDIEAKRKIRAALIYPAIVITLSIVSVGILIGFVLPRFVVFFKEYGAKLPLATRMLVSVSNFTIDYGLLIVGVVVATALLIGASRFTAQGRLLFDRAMLAAPLAGKVVRFAVVERFCRILGSMVEAGVPLPVALDLAASGSSNKAFAARIAIARREMIEGEGLYAPLAATAMFPVAAIQMLRVGEETGTLERRLDEVSTFYGKELEHKLKKLTDMLEPAAVVIVGLMVGFVAIAIISAIYGVFSGTKLK